MSDARAAAASADLHPTGWMERLHRHIDPATSLGELLFGLIMTLTFTLAAGVIMQEEGREGARELLIAVLGCNIAWGIIDAALYLSSNLLERGERRSSASACAAAARPNRWRCSPSVSTTCSKTACPPTSARRCTGASSRG